MKLATWNVNSIRARQDRLLAWLAVEQPDILCLQETKVEDAGFPGDALAAAGYQFATLGQKSYNGVAILSRTAIADVTRGFDDGESDTDARLIAGTIEGLRVVCAYVPNGGDLDSDKYPVKLAWYRRLRRYLDRVATPRTPLAVCGDFNVTIDDRDVWSPAAWNGKIHCSPPERAALAEVLAFGLIDVFRAQHPDETLFSWWDYRGVSFFKNQGLRIDYVFATPPVVERCTASRIDRDQRKGKDASDHAPVVVELAGSF